MQISSRFLRSSLVLVALLSFTDCRKPPKPVAQVAGAWVGQPQWKLYLERHAAATPAASLEALVRREVAWQQAERQGLLKGDDWTAFQDRNRVSVLGKAYLHQLPGPPPMTEAQAKAHFLASQEQRHVLHLVCKTREQAQAALVRIQKGESFEQVATKVSIDPTAGANHGDLGWIRREQMVQPFGDAVFPAKPNVVVGPFQTEFGWHLARVQEIKPATEDDYQKARATVLAGLEEMNENDRRSEALKSLRTTLPLQVDREVLSLDHTTVAAPGDEGRVAGRVGSEKISLKELKRFMADVMNVNGQSHGLGVETKRQFLEFMADDRRLSMAAEKAGLPKRPEVKAAIWDGEREAAYQLLARAYLSAYKAPDGDLKAHYAATPERFRGVGAVKVYLLVADRPETVDLAAHESMKGVAWPRLVAKYANRESTGKWDAGWLEIAALERVLPKAAIEALQGKTGGTLIGPVPSPEGAMLFKVLERRPGKVMPFEECREAVQKDYLKTQGEAVLAKYLDGEGRAGMTVKTFPENLQVH